MQRINRRRWTRWAIGIAVVLFCAGTVLSWLPNKRVVIRPKIELLLDDISEEPTPDNIEVLISKARAHRSGDSWGVDSSLDKNNLAPNEIAHVARYLRKQYPFENLTERLAYEREAKRKRIRLSNSADAWLNELESTRKSEPYTKVFSPDFVAERAEALKQLHSDEVVAFINREGEGLSRMPTYGVEYVVLPEAPAVPLAMKPPTMNVTTMNVTTNAVTMNTGTLDSMHKARPQQHHYARNHNQKTRTPFFDLHATYRKDFAASRNGLIVDVDQVAGFAPHAITRREDIFSDFTTGPSSSTQTPVYHSNAETSPDLETQPTLLWRVANLQLVSLLKFDRPHVYVSEFMPAMTELPDLEMRDLTSFEDKALKRLYAGEDIVSESTDHKIKMFGSLRASNDCRECHSSVDRGELLGAFSYELVRAATPSDSPISSPSNGTLAKATSLNRGDIGEVRH